MASPENYSLSVVEYRNYENVLRINSLPRDDVAVHCSAPLEKVMVRAANMMCAPAYTVLCHDGTSEGVVCARFMSVMLKCMRNCHGTNVEFYVGYTDEVLQVVHRSENRTMTAQFRSASPRVEEMLVEMFRALGDGSVGILKDVLVMNLVWGEGIQGKVAKMLVRMMGETRYGVYERPPMVTLIDMDDGEMMKHVYDIALRPNAGFWYTFYANNAVEVEEFYNRVMEHGLYPYVRKDTFRPPVFMLTSGNNDDVMDAYRAQHYTKVLKWLVTEDGSLTMEQEALLRDRWLENVDNVHLVQSLMAMASGILNIDKSIDDTAGREHDYVLLRKLRCVSKATRPSMISGDIWEHMLEGHRNGIETRLRGAISCGMRGPGKTGFTGFLQLVEKTLGIVFETKRMMAIAKCVEVGDSMRDFLGRGVDVGMV
jgi:hypothetical protein